MKKAAGIVFFVLLCIHCSISPNALSQDRGNDSRARASKQLTLARAEICEGIENKTPQNPGIVFPVYIGKVICFTTFDPVPEKTFIYHKWYFRDKPSTRHKLSLQPPRWSTFSRIQLREADKGPWRVEVTDGEDNILHVLRFSITD